MSLCRCGDLPGPTKVRRLGKHQCTWRRDWRCSGDGHSVTGRRCAVLETPVGAMQGLYHMETDTGASFDAPIEAFTLAVPGLLH